MLSSIINGFSNGFATEAQVATMVQIANDLHALRPEFFPAADEDMTKGFEATSQVNATAWIDNQIATRRRIRKANRAS